MRRILAWCVAGLPFAPRSRRAIDETLADWTHEDRQASNLGRRTFAGIQGVLSLARVVSLSVVREVVDLSWSRGLARRWQVVAVAALLVALAPEVLVSAAGGIGSPIAVALSLPLALLAVLPPAIFLMFAWRPGSRALPTAGTACLLTFAVLILAGWLVPLSGDVLQDFLRQSVVGEQPLLGDIPYPPPVSRAEALLAVTGWAAVVGATAICAAMMARRSPLESRWWLAGVPVIYLALIPVFQYTIGSSFLVFLSAGDPPVGFRPGIAAWTTAAVLMAGALPGGLTAGQERSDYGVPS